MPKRKNNKYIIINNKNTVQKFKKIIPILGFLCIRKIELKFINLIFVCYKKIILLI